MFRLLWEAAKLTLTPTPPLGGGSAKLTSITSIFPHFFKSAIQRFVGHFPESPEVED